jgi:anti-sigma factor RsiW
MTRLRRWGRAGRAEPASCVTIREAISASLDGEMPGIRAKESETHLARCPECRRFKTELGILARLVRPDVTRPAPEALKELLVTVLTGNAGDVAHRLPRESRPTRQRVVWRRGVCWFGALTPAALAAVVLPLGGLSSPHEIPTRALTPCTIYLQSLEGRFVSGGAVLVMPSPRQPR